MFSRSAPKKICSGRVYGSALELRKICEVYQVRNAFVFQIVATSGRDGSEKRQGSAVVPGSVNKILRTRQLVFLPIVNIMPFVRFIYVVFLILTSC